MSAHNARELVSRLAQVPQSVRRAELDEWMEGSRSRGVMDSTAENTTATLGEFGTDRPFWSLLSTTRNVLLSPRRFFDELPPDGPLGTPVLYFLICYALNTAINLVVGLATVAVPMGLAMAAGSQDARPATVVIVVLALVLVALVLLPLLSVVLFFVSVLIQHLIIRLLAGRNQRGLPATLRVSCYSVGAPVAVSWVPLVNLVVAFYCFYLFTTGLRRVHRISTVKALAAILIAAALFLVPVVVGGVYAYNLVQAAREAPVSYYFPEPEAAEKLPPGVVGAASLMDGREDQARVRELRDGSYSDEPPSETYHTEVSIGSADAKGYPRGVRGFAREAGGGVVKIAPDDPKESTPDTENILYYTSEEKVSSPPDFYKTPVVQQALHQEFMLRGGGPYTIELEQVGKEPRTITVSLFSDPETQKGTAYFHVPYRVSEPEDRFKIEVSPGTPLDDLRLQIDRGGDGTYEQSWMPEASILGEAAQDRASPVTEATLKEDPKRERPLLVLDATDRGSPDAGVPPSGIGITYYWVNDSGVRIYTGPVPVEAGDEVTYWSIDRAANLEWRRTVDVGAR